MDYVKYWLDEYGNLNVKYIDYKTGTPNPKDPSAQIEMELYALGALALAKMHKKKHGNLKTIGGEDYLFCKLKPIIINFDSSTNTVAYHGIPPKITEVQTILKHVQAENLGVGDAENPVAEDFEVANSFSQENNALNLLLLLLAVHQLKNTIRKPKKNQSPNPCFYVTANPDNKEQTNGNQMNEASYTRLMF